MHSRSLLYSWIIQTGEIFFFLINIYLSFNFLLLASLLQSKCLIGYQCPHPSEQIQCNPGQYCPEGSVNATVCVEGTYCAYPGLQINCARGMFCPAGSKFPTFCDGGVICDGTSSIIDCPASYFCAPGTAQPLKCTGTTWSDVKASFCSSCPG